MKIALTVHTAYPDFIGGREHHVHNLASELAHTDEVVVIAGGKSKKKQCRIIGGYKLVTLPMISIKVSSNPLQIYRIIPKFLSCLKQESPDIVHAFEYGSFSTDVTYFYAKKHKIPFLLNVYGYQFNKLLLKLLKKIYDRTIGRALLKGASKIFFSSRTQQYEILSIANDNKIAHKMMLQENSIKADDYQGVTSNPNLAKKYKINDELILLTVVRLLPRKGIKYLILALNKIKNELNIQNVKLLIIGPNCGELANLKNLVKTHGLKNDVAFIGPVALNEVKDFLNICDIFILPSLYEGLPLALLEAMASGRAVIFSDLLCAKKIIANGINGLLVNPADAHSLAEAIVKLARDKRLRDHLGHNAAESVRKINSCAEAKNVKKLYVQALKDYAAKAQVEI
ncbi:MAG: glycosyltransferase family 4 protein [Candidatus Omnitrophica bacterium]|nr:glycosyltransferase family 4 protein [Candidatus Omnitrophota bacterium]